MADAIGTSVHVQPESREEPARKAAGSVPAWMERLIQREGPGILRMLWRILGREADVLDAYQDCFCKLASRGTLGDVRSARAYAYRTASNIAIEMLRVRTRHRAHLPAISASQARGADRNGRSGVHAGKDRAGELRGAIADLPPHLRQVIVLRDLSRMSYSDVGNTLGISPATARVYRRHAVVKLADLLKGSES